MNFFPSKDFIDFTVVSIPTTTNFRGINKREVALFRGSEGWSEFSPFVEYATTESATWLRAALEAANTPWPNLYRKRIPINAMVPNVAAEKVAKILKNFEGCSTVKIKVDDFISGAELVEETLNILPNVKIRLDVNGSWSLEEALIYLYDFHLRFGSIFEYIEQPCANIEDLIKLKAEIPMKVALDESIRKNLGSDLSNLQAAGDFAIIKWAPSGGFAAAHTIVENIGLPVIVSSALDTGIGISHSLALAASFENLDYACGLGTVALLESDVCEPALIPQHGYLEANRVEPNFALIEKYRASEDRQEWWKNRVADIWKEWNL